MLLLPPNAKIICQGLTGSEGRSSLPGMLAYGTHIVAGVTPGKGGQTVENIPVFNTVKEAQTTLGRVDGAVQFVPPLFTKDAVLEGIDAGLKFILISAEKVPAKDAAIIYASARKHQVSVIGPSSVGYLSPQRRIKIGAIGGADPRQVFAPGHVAVISKSGGMTSEIGLLLKNHGLGVSWAVGIGGDRIVATDFSDLLLALENDAATKAAVIFGELGGTGEQKVAGLVKDGRLTKPLVAFITGEFAAGLPSEVQFGHAGAIIEGQAGLPSEKKRLLRESGVLTADKFDDIPKLLQKIT